MQFPISHLHIRILNGFIVKVWKFSHSIVGTYATIVIQDALVRSRRKIVLLWWFCWRKITVIHSHFWFTIYLTPWASWSNGTCLMTSNGVVFLCILYPSLQADFVLKEVPINAGQGFYFPIVFPTPIILCHHSIKKYGLPPWTKGKTTEQITRYEVQNLAVFFNNEAFNILQFYAVVWKIACSRLPSSAAIL